MMQPRVDIPQRLQRKILFLLCHFLTKMMRQVRSALVTLQMVMLTKNQTPSERVWMSLKRWARKSLLDDADFGYIMVLDLEFASHCKLKRFLHSP